MIVVYSLIVARIAKMNVIIAMFVVANEFEGLNRGCAIDYWAHRETLEERRREDAIKL
jgi:hypothetical protein